MQASSTEGMVLNISQNANKSKEQREITQLVEPAQKAFCFFLANATIKEIEIENQNLNPNEV